MGKIVVMVVDQQSFLGMELHKAIIQRSDITGIEIIECDPGIDGNEAVAQIDTISPDVVLLDINFPYRDGLVLCRKIVRKTPQTKVVMLTSNPTVDDDELFEAIRSGASAYLMTESCTSQEFIATIERAARGEYPINESVTNRPEIALRVLRQFEQIVCNVRKEDDVSTPLNPREAEILAHVVKGKANKEIGSILGISESTVKKHITSILRKLNANDRAHAVVLAVRDGVVSIQPNDGISLCNNDVLNKVSDTTEELGQITDDEISIRSRILLDAEEIARQIIDEAEQKGKTDAGKIIAEAVAEAKHNASHIIEEAERLKSEILDNANIKAMGIIDEAEQEGKTDAGKIIAEAVIEAKHNASQIIEEVERSKSEILDNANTKAKGIIDEAEQDIENNASQILAEVIALAEQQGSNIICEAKKKAEVDAGIISGQAREAAQSASEEIKAQGKIEANKITAEAEQSAKQLVEHAKNEAKWEAAAIVAEAHKKASDILQEAENVQSNMLSDAEEAAKRLTEEAKQKAADDAGRVILEAEHRASRILEESKGKTQEEVDNILERHNKAAQFTAEEIKAKAEEEASKLIAEAAEKSKRVIEDADNKAKSKASAIMGEAHKKASQIIEEIGDIKSNILAEAEEAAKRIIEEAKQRGEADEQRVIAEAEQKANQIIEQATIKQQETVIKENAKSPKTYDGVIELALAPTVNVSTLCELHRQLKQDPNVDVLSIKGSVDEGLKIRMLMRTPIPILEFVKGIAAVRDASEDNSAAQSETGEILKRILVTTY
jgi:two-component system response regulator DegU